MGVTISRTGIRVAYVGLASDLDPTVADTNGATDVYAYTPPPDIAMRGARASGLDKFLLDDSILFAPPEAGFEVGFYRSADTTFDPADDLLLDTLAISDPDDLSITRHRIELTIGSGPGEIALPGVEGVTDTDSDYFILVVADHLGAVTEGDTDPFNEDNSATFSGAYHLPGGPIFYHGREATSSALPAVLEIAAGASIVDDLSVTVSGSKLTLTNAALGGSTLTYTVEDGVGLRARLHSGDDRAVGTEMADLLLGGDGKDLLDGVGGDDSLGGGPGDDTIFGGPGFDTIYDGSDDDLIDLGPDGGVIVPTPGSDDVFIASDAQDILDFSLASRPITIDLDTEAVQTVDSAGNTIRLIGHFEHFVGSDAQLDSTVFMKPGLKLRVVVGGNGLNDRLIFDGLGRPVTFDGTTFRTPGLGDVTAQGFERIQTVNVAPRIIDNSDPAPAYSDIGNWFASDPNFPQGFNGGVRFNAAGSGNDVATWQFTNIPPGNYLVAATWTFAGDRAKNSPFTIRDGGPTGPIAATVRVNQEQNPGEFDPPEDTQNILFRNLAAVRITGHTLTVQLSDDADQFVSADAVRIETLEALPTANLWSPIILDDGDPGFTSTCPTDSLLNNASNRGAFGDRRRCSLANDVTTWDFGLVPPGVYQVGGTWTPDPLNPTNADFQVQVGAKQSSAQVNQRVAPDSFQDGEIWFESIFTLSSGSLAEALKVIHSGPGVADSVYLAALQEGMEALYTSNLVILPTSDASLPDSAINPATGQAHTQGEFVLRNTGVAPLTVSQILVNGTGFSLLHPPQLPWILSPNGRGTFEVEFNGNALGTFNGEVSI